MLIIIELQNNEPIQKTILYRGLHQYCCGLWDFANFYFHHIANFGHRKYTRKERDHYHLFHGDLHCAELYFAQIV